jgi:hypothetical protein
MKAFKGMSLAEIKRYHAVVEEECRLYISACADFKENPSLNNWKAYMQKYPAIYAALWNSFFWRMYLKEQSSTAAHNAGVSVMIYENMLQNYQSAMCNYELDHAFSKDLCNLAK